MKSELIYTIKENQRICLYQDGNNPDKEFIQTENKIFDARKQIKNSDIQKGIEEIRGLGIKTN